MRVPRVRPNEKKTTMSTMNEWGPFTPGLDPCELKARLRSLAAIVRLNLGRDGDLVARMVWCAEQGAVTLDALHAAIERLPAIPKRRIWASYAALTRPQAPCNP